MPETEAHAEAYQALYRKWRPKTFEDVVGQSHITDILKSQVSSGHLSHAYLFTGTRGTGKTTCAKILSRAVNCENPIDGNPCNECRICRGILEDNNTDVQEIDAASNNGVDNVRMLRDDAMYLPSTGRKRVYIIDEVHMMSTSAFNALLKIIEEPPEHLIFILATTELNKVPATILSRCQRFSFKRIMPEDIAKRLDYIAYQEGIVLTEDGSALLARLADGALRDALSLLDQCAAQGGTVDRDAVLNTLGLAGNLRTAHLMNDIRKCDTSAALLELNSLYANGKKIDSLLGELTTLGRDLLLMKTMREGAGSLLAGGYDNKTLETLQNNFPAERLIRILTLLQDTLARLKNSADPRTDAELCLIRMCNESMDGGTDALAARIARLEDAVANGTVIASSPVTEDLPEAETERPSEPEKPKPAAPRKKKPAPVPEFWAAVSKAADQRVSSSHKNFLTAADRCNAKLDGNRLTVYAFDKVAKSLIDCDEVKEALRAVMQEQMKMSVIVTITEGQPETDSADDNFNALVDMTDRMGGTVIHAE